MALPRFAPSTSASAAAGVMKWEYASDMISSTVATLECAAQVSAAAITMHSTGSPVIDCRRVRTIGASSAGARLTIRMCKASSISPRPIAMRPAFLMRDCVAEAECQQAENEQHRRDRRDIEGKRLDDQRGSDIRAQHDRQRA